MKKIISSIAVVALCFGTIAMIRSESAREQNPKPGTIPQITSAPYRDGIYQGKLAAEHGGNRRVPSGRWARQEDRAAFAAAFQQGCGTCHGVVAR
jgi:mono/diheme cytochrome c family protein